MNNEHFDEEKAIQRLMRYLAIEGTTGNEKAIGESVMADLVAAGLPRKSIRFDTAHEKIPLPTQCGNLIATIPGTGPRLMLSTHLDTVPLCAGAVPVRNGDRITPAGQTALGGDNRTGVACLATAIITLLEREIPHPPLTLLFTVREESGLWGARFVDTDELERPAMGINIDGGLPSDLVVGAVGAERWEVDITGRAAHAGVHPEQGVSATMVAALALASIESDGWFGKIKKKGKEGTSNVGSFGGKNGSPAGAATNVVNDYVHIRGESRSHDARFAAQITAAYRTAFQKAAKKIKDHKGRGAKVQFEARRDYFPFRLPDTAPVVKRVCSAIESMKMKPNLKVTNGGLDANWLVKHGIPTVTIGAGQNEIHTVNEFVHIPDFLRGCRLLLRAITTR